MKLLSDRRWKLVGGAIVAASAITVAAIWWRSRQPAAVGNSEPPAVVGILPQETLWVGVLSSKEAVWAQLASLGTPASRSAMQTIWQGWQKPLQSSLWDYRRDVQPWVGEEIAIAQLSSATQLRQQDLANRVVDEATLAVLPIAKPEVAREVLGKLGKENRDGVKRVDRNVGGVNITEISDAKGKIAFAILAEGKLAIASNRTDVVEKAIVAANGGKVLEKLPGFLAAWRQLPASQPAARIFVNFPVAVATLAARSPQPLSPDKLARLQQQQGTIANVEIEPAGLRFYGLSWWKPKTAKLKPNTSAPNVASRLPKDTLLTISGRDLPQLWQDLRSATANNPLAPVKADAVAAGVNSLVGLNLEKDVLKWTQGDFGIAIVPKPPQSNSELSAGALLLLQSSDRAATDRTLSQIDLAMKSKYGFAAKPMAGNAAVEWVSPLGGVSGTRGWLDGNVAFLSLGAPIAPRFVPHPADKLADHPQFQLATRSQISPIQGQFYIDVEKTLIPGNLPIPKLPPEPQKILSAIQAIGITSGVVDPDNYRFDMFIKIANQ
jgi:hypothetical protein